MIKIEHPDLVKIAEEYYAKIKTVCIKRAQALEIILDILFSGRSYNDLVNFNLTGQTKKSLCNLVLTPQHKLGKNPNYNNVVQARCKGEIIANHAILSQIAVYLKDDNNLKDLILIPPEDSYQKNLDLINHFGINAANQDAALSLINKVIDYSIFDGVAYWLGAKLGINTCPYCNRSFIHTIVDRHRKEIIRPTFDHFYPQSRHPFLSLSFYNLIPSCYYCNSSLKTATVITPNTHLHPYLEGFGEDGRFKILVVGNKPNKSDPENYSIWLQEFIPNTQPKYRKIFGNSQVEGNRNLFQINQLYMSHRDVVGELIVKCDKYSGGHADSLHKILGQLGTDKSEFYKFYFGNYLNDKDFHRRPLAKMTKDIVKQELPNFFK